MKKSLEEFLREDYIESLFSCTKNITGTDNITLARFKSIWEEAGTELPKQYKISLEEKNVFEETFLISSVSHRNYILGKYLILSNANIKALNKKLENIFHIAAKIGATDFIKFMIEQDLLTTAENDSERICINDKDKFGYTALKISETVGATDVSSLIKSTYPVLDESDPVYDLNDSTSIKSVENEKLKFTIHENLEKTYEQLYQGDFSNKDMCTSNDKEVTGENSDFDQSSL